MLPTAMTEKTAHHGKNVKRIRDILGIKQDALAAEVGLSQQAISQLEQKEVLEADLLEKVAKALKVSPEAIKNFSEEAAVNYFNTFNDNSINNGVVYAFSSTINPMEKWVEALEENRKLIEQNTKLYERLLQSEQEKIILLRNGAK